MASSTMSLKTTTTISPDPEARLSSLLRRRELGLENDSRFTQQKLRYRSIDNLAPIRSWKGASGDIVSATWSADSQSYALGATATSNVEDLQYNRPHNLLFGNIRDNSLRELVDHRIPRPRPDTIPSGPNSSEAVYDTCDPMIYKTVEDVRFSPTGQTLYSASHDSTVKVWDSDNDKGIPICTSTLMHDANVTALEVSKFFPNTFVTASHNVKDSIRVYTKQSEGYIHVTFESERAHAKPQHDILPACIRWGLVPTNQHLMLAGFLRWGELPNHDPGREGDLCLWNVATGDKLKVVPSAHSIYTAAFHPFLDAFSTGGAAGIRLTHRHTTRSVVRTWDRRMASMSYECECPALDMQDLVFHPQESNILAVGCTDGSTYVWDVRKANHILHRLEHGDPIADWDQKYAQTPTTREQGDGGVNMTLWGTGRHNLYTGATDGMVKCWNINRAPEDAFIRNVAQLPAGVSCGSFSPDFVTLLVGDSTGGVYLLSSDAGGEYHFDDHSDSADVSTQKIKFIPAPCDDSTYPTEQLGLGQRTAREMIRSGQLIIDPEFGVGQGPAYAGPYAKYAYKEGSTRLMREYEKRQPVSRKGRVRNNAAARNIKAMLARRREELGSTEEDPDIIDLTSDIENDPIAARVELIDLTSDTEKDLVEEKEKRVDRNVVDGEVWDDGPMEDDYWFPYMDHETLLRLKGQYPF
ncbi:MAG: hypothetical protein Q9191_004601 [Dirinaria sp. TL-2023a]